MFLEKLYDLKQLTRHIFYTDTESLNPASNLIRKTIENAVKLSEIYSPKYWST